MKNQAPWQLTVKRTERITPNMQRITFSGDGLQGFPLDTASAYLKIAFPIPEGRSTSLKGIAKKILGRKSTAVRSYTVRKFEPQTNELEVDFVAHEHSGIASTWALNASVGDKVEAGGPGPKKLLKQTGDWYLIVGDMSALPAIGANLAALPADAEGYALIEILDDADRQELDSPPGVEIRWLVNPDTEKSAEIILQEIRAIGSQAGECEAWVAGELGTVRAVRSYLKSELGMQRNQFYASSYWQFGQADEQHRIAKASDH